MCGEDVRDARAGLLGRSEDARGFVPGIHDHAVAGRAVLHDAAVLLERADDYGGDIEVHGRCGTARDPRGASFRGRALRGRLRPHAQQDIPPLGRRARGLEVHAAAHEVPVLASEFALCLDVRDPQFR